jgi:hypothetical protein
VFFILLVAWKDKQIGPVSARTHNALKP